MSDERVGVASVSRAPAGSRFGCVDAYAWSHDWRLDDKAWHLGGLEYIEPLGVFCPRGVPATDAMTIGTGSSEWTVIAGDYWRAAKPPGVPQVLMLGAYDSRVHPATPLSAHLHGISRKGPLRNDWELTMYQYPAPAGQTQYPQVSVLQPCEWQDETGTWGDGILILWLPHHQRDKWRQPMLSVYPGTTWPVDGVVDAGVDDILIGQFAGAGVTAHTARGQRGGEWSRVRFETFCYGTDKQLLRIACPGASEYWYYTNDRLRLSPTADGVAGAIGITVQGHVAVVHLGEMNWVGGSAWARKYMDLPTDANTPLVWSAQCADPMGWTIEVDALAAPANKAMPSLTMTPGMEIGRPLVSLVSAAVASSYTAISGSAVALEGVVDEVSITRNRQQIGQGATVTLRPRAATLADTWKIGDHITIEAGWNSDSSNPPAQRIDGYLIAPVRKRMAAGMQYATVTLDLGDYVLAKLRGHKTMMDRRQAGGRTLTAWWTELWDSLGIPVANVEVRCTGTTVIPLSETPGQPSYAPDESQSPEQHIAEVCLAMGLRWGIEADHTVYLDVVDSYVDGTSAISETLSEGSTDRLKRLDDLGHTRDASEATNRYKVWTGKGEYRTASYHGDLQAAIEAGVCDAYERVLEYADVTEASAAMSRIQDEILRRSSVISYMSPYRPDLEPGMYIEIGTINWLDVTAGDVYQISEMVDRLSWRNKRAESRITLQFVGVHTPEE